MNSWATRLSLLKIRCGEVPEFVMLLGVAMSSALYGNQSHFALGQSAVAIPFQLVDNRIYLRVGVNGSRPLFFMLDSGASQSVLDVRHAMSLGLAMQGLEKVESGIGAAPPDAYVLTDAVSFSLPGFVFSADHAVAIALDRTQACLEAAAAGGKVRNMPGPTPKQQGEAVIDGILGQDFLGTAVVEIDYAAGLINLYGSDSYQYMGTGESIPLEIDQQLLFVVTRVKAPRRPSATARLVVDTGSGSALSLTREFAERHQVFLPASKLTPATECGIAGNSKEATVFGNLELLQLGRLTVSKPKTVFYRGTADRWYDGLLGTPALRHFKVIFDCARSRLILEQSHRLPKYK